VDPTKANATNKTLENALKYGCVDIAKEMQSRSADVMLIAWNWKSETAMKPFQNAGTTEIFAMIKTSALKMFAIPRSDVFTFQRPAMTTTCAPKMYAIQSLDALILLWLVMMLLLALLILAILKMVNAKTFQTTQNVPPSINALLATALSLDANTSRIIHA
jgi:hypothetical protein